MNKDMIIIADYTEDGALSLEDICEICQIEMVQVNDMIAYDILSPQGQSRDEWVFDMDQLKRLRTALRLQRDLEINYAGIALVMELLEELETLRAAQSLYDKHLLK